MALLIGVPKETAPDEKRVATVPDVVEKLVKLGFSVAVESGAGDGANFGGRRLPRRWRRGRAQRLPNSGPRADIVFKVRAPSPEEVGLMRDGRHADRLHLAGAEPRAHAAAGGQEGYRARHRLPAAPAFARAEDGRADLHGRRHRLPGSDRGRQRVRPLLQRPDHRRRQDSAGQDLHRRRRGRRVWRRSARPPAWAPSCAPTTRAPRSPTRSCRWVANSSRSTTRKKAPAAAATPR